MPVDMFRLFKEVRGMGGHSEVTRKQGWDEISEVVGLQGSGKGVEQAYLRYLSDFEVRSSEVFLLLRREGRVERARERERRVLRPSGFLRSAWSVCGRWAH